MLPKKTIHKQRKHVRAWRSQAYWKKMRGAYAGQTGFIIGNGPSLKIDDLTRIHALSEKRAKETGRGIISIASNKIYLAYESTPWRPTVFTACDDLVWQKIAPTLHQHTPHVITPWDMPTLRTPGIAHQHFKQLSMQAADITQAFSANAARGLYGGYTVTATNLQIAAHLGLTKLYLIGCDHYYAGENTQAAESKPLGAVQTTGQSNHFHPNYRAAGETVNPAPIALMERAYTAAREGCNARGIEVYNATRGGHLEIFPRADLDAVLG